MSIRIENNLKKKDPSMFEQIAHFIPCSLEEDGPANVEKYFNPHVSGDDLNGLLGTLRGHQLQGIKLDFNQNRRMLLISESRKPLTENAERRLQVTGGFRDITYWNWDKIPSKNEPFIKALDWIDIAKAVHDND